MGNVPEGTDKENSRQSGDSRRAFITKAAAASGAAVVGTSLSPAASKAQSPIAKRNRAEGHSGIHTDTDGVQAIQLTPRDLGPTPPLFADGGGGLAVQYPVGFVPTGKGQGANAAPDFHIRMF